MKKQIAIAFLVTAATAMAAVKVGQPAPDLQLPDTQGKQHSLADYKGKYVVLEWVNHDCPFVKKHYESGNMQKLQKEWTGKDVIWLTVSSSAPGKQGNMPPEKWNEVTQEKNAAPTAVLVDEDGTVGKKYGATATPHMFVINPEGELIYQGAIDSIDTADKEDISKATNYVDAALESAMAGRPVETASTKAYGCSIKYE